MHNCPSWTGGAAARSKEWCAASKSAQMGWLFKKLLLNNHPGASRHPSCPGGAIPSHRHIIHNRLMKCMLPILMVVLSSPCLLAQQPEALVSVGGLRVPACTVSSDPEYGHIAAKPIQLGGGPAYADSRLARFIGALRGPQGQMLKIGNARGSLFASAVYWDEPTILDQYSVSYDDKTFPIYVDSYHFSLPKAPSGFTCSGPLVTAVGGPPLDPMKTNTNIIALAIEQGSVKDIAPVTLDPAVKRGYLMDQFTMIALRARAAANAGMPLDPKKPPAGINGAELVVFAVPVPCGARMVEPRNIEMNSTQGFVPAVGQPLQGDALNQQIFGLPIPAGSLAVKFRQAQVTHIRITYAESCEGAPTDVVLQIKTETPRIISSSPATIPPGISEPEPTVYLQVILDTNGEFVHPLHIGGPKSLLPTAIESIRQWKLEPFRLNGTPNISPTILQVIFQ